MVTTCVGLVFGLNYPGTRFALKGCVNDAWMAHKFCKNVLQAKAENIAIHVDDKSSFGNPATKNMLTKADMIEALKKFVNTVNTVRPRFAFLHYSGHGIGVRDRFLISDDEKDNQDECLVTGDDKRISDDFLFKEVVQKIPEHTTLFAVMDCCHSGSVLDLQWRWQMYPSGRLHRENMNTCLANVFAISGCRDTETSADAYNREEHISEGALSGTLYRHIGNYTPTKLARLSYTKLANSIHSMLKEGGYSQRPQLSFSKKPGDDVMNILFGEKDRSRMGDVSDVSNVSDVSDMSGTGDVSEMVTVSGMFTMSGFGIRRAMKTYGLSGNRHTKRFFSDDELIPMSTKDKYVPMYSW